MEGSMNRRDFLSGGLAAVPGFMIARACAGAGANRCTGLRGDWSLAATDGWFAHAAGLDIPARIALLKKVGYAGMALSWNSADREAHLRELRKHQLGVPGLFLACPPGTSIEGPLEFLKGCRSWIWMSLEQPGPTGSIEAGSIAEYLARCAQQSSAAGLSGIGLHPRPGTWLAGSESAQRLADRLNRPDVGWVFDLESWRSEDPAPDLRPLIERGLSRMKGVVIHGSDTASSVLPLGEGSYDPSPLLQTLADLNYSGPFMHPAAGVETRIPERLEASFRVWEGLKRKATEGRTERVRAHVFISGVVQGVSFRASTQEEAQRRGVTGWVRNLKDGRVEAVLQGRKDQVGELLQWCHKGPPAARVEKVVVTWEGALDDSRGFDILP